MENGVLIHGLLFVNMFQLIEIIRMIYGPLHSFICWMQAFLRNGATVGIILYLDMIVIFKVRNKL